MKHIRWIFLTLITVVAGILLALAVFGTGGMNELIPEGLLRTETMVLLVVLTVCVPVLLIILLLVVLFAKPEEKTVTAVIGSTGNIIANVPTTLPSAQPEGEGTEAVSEVTERFCMLSEIERKHLGMPKVAYDRNVTLAEFCASFRDYAASNLKLYYDISDIRRFIAGMAVSHILILQGMSGTGKTSLAHAFGSFVDNSSTIIPVQPMWKERTDLVGYYNEFTKKFNETLLLEKMYEANYSENMYVTVLDEMNIARVEYYFAEFLSLLELPNPDERYIDVVSDKWENDPKQLKDGRIKLPENMWFIGTANNDDSTFAISDKVYDRAMVLNLDNKSERYIAPKTGKTRISYAQFTELVKGATEEYGLSARNRKRLEELDKYMIEHFHITFGNRIMKQINTYVPVYISCGGGELEALDDILSKKVIRKLETQNPIYLRNAAEGLISYLDELFGQENMTLCKEYVHRLQRNS